MDSLPGGIVSDTGKNVRMYHKDIDVSVPSVAADGFLL